MHTPTPTLSSCAEKDASMLHFIRPSPGFVNFMGPKDLLWWVHAVIRHSLVIHKPTTILFHGFKIYKQLTTF